MRRNITYSTILSGVSQNREGVFVFLVASLNSWRVNLASINLSGMLPFGEILAAVFLLFLWKSWIWKRKEVQAVMLALAYMLGFQVLSDLVNSSAFEDYSRGWAGIIMMMSNFLFFLMIFYKRPSAIIFYYLGMIVAGAIGGRYELALESDKYFGVMIAPMISPAIILLGMYFFKKSYRLMVLLFACYSILLFSQNSRGSALVFLIPCFVMIMKRKGVFANKIRFVRIAIPWMVVLYAGYCCYVYTVTEKGFAGEHSRRQFLECNNPYNPLELLVIGRTSSFLPLYAIKEKPIFGYGSWAEDKEFFNLKIADLRNNPLSFGTLTKTDHIRCHSAILGIWLWSGIGGLVSFIFLCKIFLKSVFKLISCNLSIYEPVILIMLFESIWSILFSPPVSVRMYLPQYTAFAFALLYIRNSQEKCFENAKVQYTRNRK